jgi:hypothetical protein
MDEGHIIERFENQFWQENSFIRYKYKTSFSCIESGCHEDDYCRCAIIEDLECDEINLFEFGNYIFNILHPSTKNINRKINILNIVQDYDYKKVNLYFIIRLLTINKLWSFNNWTCKIENGYYGQELGFIKIIDDIFFKLRKEIIELFNKDSIKEKVEHSLILEYQWLRNDLSGKSYEIQTVPKSKLIFPEKTHHLRVQSKNLDYLKNCKVDLPSGIVIQKGDNYYLVDGYHRAIAHDKDLITLIIAK